jgi:predicted urease superfamily metal-dependent hydrolase
MDDIGRGEIFRIGRGGTQLADEPLKLSEKIAKQIAQIAKDSVKIDLEILEFLKEDYEEIKRIAKEERISPAELIATILEGIKEGLIEGGIVSIEMIKNILSASKTELEELESRWRDENKRK